MPGARTIPATPIFPDLPLDGVSEVESDRPGNAKYGFAEDEMTGAQGFASGNLTMEENRPPQDPGVTNPFSFLYGKR